MTSDAPIKKTTAASRSAGGQADNVNGQGATKARRRTKTGCLTCRKRRIKCDEGSPTCNNCHKSKRQCEGYQTTRLQLRANGNEFGPAVVGHPFDSQLMYGPAGHFASILPRPLQGGSDHHDFNSQPTQWANNPNPAPEEGFESAYMASLFAQKQMSPSAPAYLSNFPNLLFASQVGGQYANTIQAPSSTTTVSSNQSADLFSPVSLDNAGTTGSNDGFPANPPQSVLPNPISADGFLWNPSIQDYDPNLYTSIPPEHFSLNERLVEDEFFDVGSDDEKTGALERNNHNALPMMMSVHAGFDVRALRTNETFLNTPNILAHYEPQWEASPLKDATTARIFGHFIAVTACHLSPGQRTASNPSLLFQTNDVPKHQQGLWTYIMPQKALSNPGLMHAMLALASLQIAMIQGTDRHTARKHYHFAIRRNSKAVGAPGQRNTISTIATTLLLASFEVWAADHSNWNSHLIGARQLLLETNMVRRTRQIKASEYNAAPALKGDDPYALYLHRKAGPVLQAEFPDEELLEKIMGYKVPYSNLGIETEDEKRKDPLSQHEIDVYDSYSDLLWFFLKQDVYYSTISSNPLLMPYNRWGDCPPRAPLGKLDAIYGTSDHLVLIYGRIAKFICDDLVRKTKAVEANGGRWRPPPGMFPGGSPPAPPGKGAGMPSPQGPGFMGMIPKPPTPRMPSAFEGTHGNSSYMPVPKEEIDIDDLDAAFQRAMMEWNEIQTVLSDFEAALQGDGWRPLPMRAVSPIATHFGSALQYGDYRIADIWAMFYTAKIILARVHPVMPPAALMAASVCAAQTAEWANTIGKIVFGMQTPKDNSPLNPTFSSVLTQNMYCLFVAGVQYQEPEQRLVCVQRLKYIAEKVGHESSALIAAALETCWINAFQMGRGPEWTRTLGLAVDSSDEDDRRKEFRTMERRKDGATVYIRSDHVRTRFGMGIMGLESDFAKMQFNDRKAMDVFPEQQIFNGV